MSFQVHSSGQHAFGRHSPLQFELMFRGRALNEFGLVDETGMSLLSCAGESSGDFLLCAKKLREQELKDWWQRRTGFRTHMGITSRHLSKSVQAACHAE
jgi:hypothetical protein